MSGKIIAAGIVTLALIAGVAIYYLQVYHYYEPVEVTDAEIVLTLLDGTPEAIPAEAVEAIDARSSPIRYRACFETPLSLAMLAESYRRYEAAEPLTGPGWFDCYDAVEIGVALERGEALAFLGTAGIQHGVDRVVAVFDDGRGFVWHQVNEDIRE